MTDVIQEWKDYYAELEDAQATLELYEAALETVLDLSGDQGGQMKSVARVALGKELT